MKYLWYLSLKHLSSILYLMKAFLFIGMVSVSMFFTFFYFRIVEAGDLNPLLKGELHVFS